GRTEVLFRAKHVDGSWRWIELTGTNLLEDHRIQGVVVNFRDVSERRDAAEALRLSEARFAGIIDSAMDSIISIGEDQRIVLFNKAAEQLFGYSAAEVIGMPLGILLPERAFHDEEFGQTGTTSRAMGNLA